MGWGGGSWHNKGSRERAAASPGWSHHTKICLLPGETLHWSFQQHQLNRESKTKAWRPRIVSPYQELPPSWRNSPPAAETGVQNELKTITLFMFAFSSAVSQNRLTNSFSRGSYASNLVFPVRAYFKYFVPNFQKFSAPPSKDSQLNAAFAIVGSCKVCK